MYNYYQSLLKALVASWHTFFQQPNVPWEVTLNPSPDPKALPWLVTPPRALLAAWMPATLSDSEPLSDKSACSVYG